MRIAILILPLLLCISAVADQPATAAQKPNVRTTSNINVPAGLLNLSRWKLTLPVDTNQPGRPDEIRPAELATFADVNCFFVNTAGDGVVFRANCGGVTTKGSEFPRSELREVDARGNSTVAWSTSDRGKHTLTMKAAITQTPPVKKHVVCAQIHDAKDDLLMVRLEETKLFIERNKLADVLLDPHYPLGAPFDLKIEASAGHVRVSHNGVEKLDWSVSNNGCYFKAGCYMQSNVDKGDAADSFGEITIFQLAVRHHSE